MEASSANAVKCRTGAAAIRRTFAVLGFAGSCKLLVSPSFWRAARKVMSPNAAPCCGQARGAVSRRRFLSKLGMGTLGGAAALTAAACGGDSNRHSDGHISEAVVDPGQRAEILSRVGPSPEFKQAMSALQRQGFRPLYGLEQVIPFRQSFGPARAKWIQVGLPFLREGVSPERVTGGDLAAILVDIDEKRVAAVAMNFSGKSEGLMYVMADGAEIGLQDVAWEPLGPEAHHVHCLLRVPFLGWCVLRLDLCVLICGILLPLACFPSCTVACLALQDYFDSPLTCEVLCPLACAGTCYTTCQGDFGH